MHLFPLILSLMVTSTAARQHSPGLVLPEGLGLFPRSDIPGSSGPPDGSAPPRPYHRTLSRLGIDPHTGQMMSPPTSNRPSLKPPSLDQGPRAVLHNDLRPTQTLSLPTTNPMQKWREYETAYRQKSGLAPVGHGSPQHFTSPPPTEGVSRLALAEQQSPRGRTAEEAAAAGKEVEARLQGQEKKSSQSQLGFGNISTRGSRSSIDLTSTAVSRHEKAQKRSASKKARAKLLEQSRPDDHAGRDDGTSA